MKITLSLSEYYIFFYKIIRNSKKKNSTLRTKKFSTVRGYKKNCNPNYNKMQKAFIYRKSKQWSDKEKL